MVEITFLNQLLEGMADARTSSAVRSVDTQIHFSRKKDEFAARVVGYTVVSILRRLGGTRLRAL